MDDISPLTLTENVKSSSVTAYVILSTFFNGGRGISTSTPTPMLKLNAGVLAKSYIPINVTVVLSLRVSSISVGILFTKVNPVNIPSKPSIFIDGFGSPIVTVPLKPS